MKSKSARIWDKELLALWSRLVKLTAGNRCEMCDKTKNLNSHHIYGRTNYNVRYDPDNGACLCAGHHMLNKDSAHKASLPFADLMIEKRGQRWYLDLQKRAFTDIYKRDKELTEQDLKDKIRLLEE